VVTSRSTTSRVLLRENDFSSSLELLLDDLEDDEYDRLVLDSLAMFGRSSRPNARSGHTR